MKKLKYSHTSFRALNIYTVLEILSFITFNIQYDFEDGFTFFLEYPQTREEHNSVIQTPIWIDTKYLDLFGKWGDSVQKTFFLWNSLKFQSYIEIKRKNHLIYIERDINVLICMLNNSHVIELSFKLEYIVEKSKKMLFLEIKEKLTNFHFIEHRVICRKGFNSKYYLCLTNNKKFISDYIKASPGNTKLLS